MTYFSSDFHLGHTNVIKFDNRPFADIGKHDAAIIRNCQELIQPDDDFYFLGDFAFKNKYKLENYLSQIPGNKFFIKGNHDHSKDIKTFEKYGTFLGNLAEVKIEGQDIVLCHYKMFTWRGSHRGTWHLYGHSHGSAEHIQIGKSFDVGINLWNYKPVSFEQVKRKMNTLSFKPVDHHE